MAANSKANQPSETRDIEANESTGLLESDSSISPGNSSQEKSFRDDEMERPWPATFERSISLLASPMINAEEADHYTKSPKPGNTPLAERRRMVSFGFVSLSRFSVFSLDTHLSFGSSELPKPLMEHCYGHWEN